MTFGQDSPRDTLRVLEEEQRLGKKAVKHCPNDDPSQRARLNDAPSFGGIDPHIVMGDNAPINY